MPLTAEKFAEGFTGAQYWDRIRVNKDAILQIYNDVEVQPEVQAYFDSLPQPLRLAVFTEPWCGDAVSSTPAIMQLAEATEKLEMRIFERDQNLDLANSFLPEDRHGTLPLFIVFDAEMREICRFIETANALVKRVDGMEGEVRQARVAAADLDKPLGEMSESSRSAFRTGRMAYRVAHACEWGKIVTGEFTAAVKEGLALPPEQRPSVGGTKWPHDS